MNKQLFAIAALFVIGIASVATVSAFRGDPQNEGPYYDEERHEEMQAAFATNDYEAWYDLMTQDARHPRIVEVINAENFETFVAIHEAKEAEDYETVAVLREELGLGQGRMMQSAGNENSYGNKLGKGSRQGQRMHCMN